MQQRNFSRDSPLLGVVAMIVLGTFCLCAAPRSAQGQTVTYYFNGSSPKNDLTEATPAVYAATDDTVTFKVTNTNELEMIYTYGSSGAAAGGSPREIDFNAPDLTSLHVDKGNALTTVAPNHIKTGVNDANLGVFGWGLQYKGGLPAESFTTVFHYTGTDSLSDVLNDMNAQMNLYPLQAAIDLHSGPNRLNYEIANEDVAPEASTLLMLTSGVAPLGMLLGYRRFRCQS